MIPLIVAGLKAAVDWVIVGAAAVAGAKFVIDSLKEEEDRKREKIEREIRRVRKEKVLLIEEIKRLKEKNRALFRKYQDLDLNSLSRKEVESLFNDLVNGKIEELKRLKEEDYVKVKKAKEMVEKDMNTLVFSSYRKRQLRKWLLIFEEAIHKYEAYFDYLKLHRKIVMKAIADRRYQDAISYSLPSPYLPENFLYVGKLLKVKKEDVNIEKGIIYVNRSYNQILRIPPKNNPYRSYEVAAFESYASDSIPVLVTANSRYNSEIFFGSFLKGILLHDYAMNQIPLEATVYEDWKKKVRIAYVNQPVGFMPRDYKKQPLRNYKVGEPLSVYIIEYDYLLRNIVFSEFHPEEVEKRDIVNIYFNLEAVEKDLFQKFAEYAETEPLMLKEMKVSESGNAKMLLIMKDIQLKVELKGEELFISKMEKIPAPSDKEVREFLFIPFEIRIVEHRYKRFAISSPESVKTFIESMWTEFQISRLKEKGEIEKFINRWKELSLLELSKGSAKDFKVKIEDFNFEEGTVIVSDSGENGESLLSAINRISMDDKDNKKPSLFLETLTGEYRELCKVEDLEVTEKGMVKLKLPESHLRKEELSKNFSLSSSVAIFFLPSNPYPVMKQLKAIDRFLNDKEIVDSDLRMKLMRPVLFKGAFSTKKKLHSYFNKQLTENQKEIVERALSSEKFFIIQGPPGTGKTTVITEIVLQTLKENPDFRILIVSQQNVAVDNVLERLKREGLSELIVRVASTDSKIGKDVKEFFIGKRIDTYIQNLKNEKVRQELSELRNEWLSLLEKDISPRTRELILSQFNLVGSTCVGLANSKLGFDVAEFDLVIVDEAGRANLGEFLIAVNRAKKLILVGDHYQLPPTISASIREEFYSLPPFEREFLEKSFFERLFEAVPNSLKGRLLEQFRMPAEIGSLVSELFYDGELKNGTVKDTSNFVYPDRIIQWIDVKGKEKSEGTSKKNTSEVMTIVDKLIEIYVICKKRNLKKSVAVITPYRAQKFALIKEYSKLIKKLPELENYLSVQINTVDAFQGKEADVVFYSTVKNRGTIKFLLDRRRLNVAISRAKENLIFVGNREFFEKTDSDENIFRKIVKKL
jgi:DNA polymerase III delta prime subunit